jgi:hypothetical protein
MSYVDCIKAIKEASEGTLKSQGGMERPRLAPTRRCRHTKAVLEKVLRPQPRTLMSATDPEMSTLKCGRTRLRQVPH